MFSRSVVRGVVKSNPHLKAIKSNNIAIRTKDGGEICVGDKFYFRHERGLFGESWPYVSGAVTGYTLENIKVEKTVSFNPQMGEIKWSVDFFVKSFLVEQEEDKGVPFYVPNSVGIYCGYLFESESWLDKSHKTRYMNLSNGAIFKTPQNAMAVPLHDGKFAEVGDEVWMWRNTVPYPALVCKKIVEIVWKQDKVIPICSYEGANYARKEKVPLFSSAEAACEACPERAMNTEHAFIRTGIIRGKREKVA